ncbi:MAG: class IV adenylate cyclase [Terriglobia bacterium]
MSPHREVEIKLKVANPLALKASLKEMGFRRTTPRLLERNIIFDFPDGRLRHAGCVLRLRTLGGTSLMTFKSKQRIQGSYKSREEFETELESAVEMQRILERLGLRAALRYNKRRTAYTAPGTTRGSRVLVYDETPAGDYIEIEGPPRWIDQVAARLGYQRGDYVTANYPALYSAARRMPRPRRARIKTPERRA